MKNANETIKPVVTLVVIALLVGLILSVCNYFTEPVIAANEAEAALENYKLALPEADSFTEMECDIEGVTAFLKADNGAGYVVTAQARGYGGQVPAVVSFTPDGTIENVIMTSNDETPGLGQKVTDEAFSKQFSGMKAENFELEDIDAISGATISSRASVNAINTAISAYNQMTGGEG